MGVRENFVKNFPPGKPPRHLGDEGTLQFLINRMPRRELAEYNDYKWRDKESMFPHRVMIVYRCGPNGPLDVEHFRIGPPEMPQLGEFQIPIETDSGNQVITYLPTRFRNREVFLHVPQRFELKWLGTENSGRVHCEPQFAMLIKTRSPEAWQQEGHTYCVSFNRFKERFPDSDFRY